MRRLLKFRLCHEQLYKGFLSGDTLADCLLSARILHSGIIKDWRILQQTLFAASGSIPTMTEFQVLTPFVVLCSVTHPARFSRLNGNLLQTTLSQG